MLALLGAIFWALCGQGSAVAEGWLYHGRVIGLAGDHRLEVSLDLWFDEHRAIKTLRLRRLNLMPGAVEELRRLARHGTEVHAEVYPDTKSALMRREYCAEVWLVEGGVRTLSLNQHLLDRGLAGVRDER